MGKLISYFLEHGGCSIQYRIRREILNVNPSDGDMINLQKEILEKPKVKKIMSNRQPDGWIGDELHGGPGKGLDSSVSFLLNYGVAKENKMFGDVVSLLHKEKEDVPYRTTFKGGEAMDTSGRGGNRAVRAGILAELGDENNWLVQEELKTSLSYLKTSLEYESIDDFTLTGKNGIRYYKPDAHFPGANHLNLLSATKSWRTPENIDLVIKAMTQCFQIMKGHSYNIMLKSEAHFVGPFNFK